MDGAGRMDVASARTTRTPATGTALTRLALLAMVAAVACGARTGALTSDGSTSDLGAPPPNDRFVLQTPVEVCARHAPGCRLYDGIAALVWTGARYALLFRERAPAGPQIQLVLRLIEPSGDVSPSTVVSDDSGSVHGSAMVWDGARLAVFWKDTDSGDVRGRAVGPTGELLGAPRTLLMQTSTTVLSLQALATAEGYALVVVFADRRARFVRLSRYPALAQLGTPALLSWPGVGDPEWDFPGPPSSLAGGGYGVTLNPRVAGGDDGVYLARLDAAGRPDGEALRIEQADTLTSAAIVADEDRLFVAYDDNFDELVLAEIAGQTIARRSTLRRGELSGPVLTPLGGADLAMLGATNLWQGPGSFPTKLVFEAYALPTGARRAQLTVEDLTGQDGAVLAWAMVRSGDSVGIAWEPAFGESSVQQIKFARITR